MCVCLCCDPVCETVTVSVCIIQCDCVCVSVSMSGDLCTSRYVSTGEFVQGSFGVLWSMYVSGNVHMHMCVCECVCSHEHISVKF